MPSDIGMLVYNDFLSRLFCCANHQNFILGKDLVIL